MRGRLSRGFSFRSEGDSARAHHLFTFEGDAVEIVGFRMSFVSFSAMTAVSNVILIFLTRCLRLPHPHSLYENANFRLACMASGVARFLTSRKFSFSSSV